MQLRKPTDLYINPNMKLIGLLKNESHRVAQRLSTLCHTYLKSKVICGNLRYIFWEI